MRLTTLNLTDEQFDWLKKNRDKHGSPMSYMIRKAIDEFMKKQGNQPPKKIKRIAVKKN